MSTHATAPNLDDSSVPPLTLRPLTREDAPALQAVYASSADFFVNSSGAAPALCQADDDLAAAAADDARYLLGIYLVETMVGVIDLRLADPGPYDVRIGLILLAPEHRRHGLGRWTLSILEEWLRQATPTEAVVLGVLAQDYAAQAFFRACGYTFTGQAIRVPVADQRYRLLTMQKRL